MLGSQKSFQQQPFRFVEIFERKEFVSNESRANSSFEGYDTRQQLIHGIIAVC